jgi:hypothetical protein
VGTTSCLQLQVREGAPEDIYDRLIAAMVTAAESYYPGITADPVAFVVAASARCSVPA